MKFIGIDPAFRKDGFCACIIDTSTNIVDFIMFKRGFIDFHNWFLPFVHVNLDWCATCVENSNMQEQTFDMSGTKEVMARKSRNVGKNQAISQITQDLCKEYLKDKSIQVSPREKGKKWTDKEFLSVAKSKKHTILNYKGTESDQDKRDAYKLALIAIAKI